MYLEFRASFFRRTTHLVHHEYLRINIDKSVVEGGAHSSRPKMSYIITVLQVGVLPQDIN